MELNQIINNSTLLNVQANYKNTNYINLFQDKSNTKSKLNRTELRLIQTRTSLAFYTNISHAFLVNEQIKTTKQSKLYDYMHYKAILSNC